LVQDIALEYHPQQHGFVRNPTGFPTPIRNGSTLTENLRERIARKEKIREKSS